MVIFLLLGDMPMCQPSIKTRSQDNAGTPVPFSSVEEAWFWFIRCQKLRNDGAQYQPSLHAVPRPCDPADVYCTAKRLHLKRQLSDEHLRVLSTFGLLEYPPDSRDGAQQRAAQVWGEALDQMLGPLRIKGIVAMPESMESSIESSIEPLPGPDHATR